MRLARFLAAGGVASRRACEDLIREGRVQVNGERVGTPACNVHPDKDDVRLDGRRIRPTRHAYLLLHKPRGYVCSANDPHATRLIYELLPDRLGRLFTVGRLDRDSEGLILVTNDGDFAQLMQHPRHRVPKTYKVMLTKPVPQAVVEAMRRGIVDRGERLQPTSVRHKNPSRRQELMIVLNEGRNREIRRLCLHFELSVRRLIRVSIGDIRLQGLSAGRWRRLTPGELRGLHALAVREG